MMCIFILWDGLTWDFLRSCFHAVSRNYLVFVIYNWLLFSAIIAGALLLQSESWFVRLPVSGDSLILGTDSVVLMAVGIFLFNLALSGFLLITLPGLAFFALPAVFLFYRALLWGILLNQLFTPQFLIALPTLILEGEGYVLAAICGTNLGLSWFRPDWIYRNRGFSRLKALETTSRECVRLYFFVVIFLIVAAVVEAVTIVSFTSWFL